MRVARVRHSVLLVIGSAVLFTACATLNDMVEQGKSLVSAPGGSNSGAPTAGGPPGAGDAHAGDAKPGDAKPGDAKPATTSGGGGGGDTFCCVNKQFFDCGTAANAVACLNDPMALMKCVQGCGSDSKCAPKCIADYGPNPDKAHCKRDPSADAKCPKLRPR